MFDVRAANLRARLVVLSCCHSGRGRLLKGKGVVGIARAFLAAGARSVLISLWTIDEEANMVFIKSFYLQLKEGKTASAAVQQTIKSLRQRKEFSEMRHRPHSNLSKMTSRSNSWQMMTSKIREITVCFLCTPQHNKQRNRFLCYY